jgi:universal stress protein A
MTNATSAAARLYRKILLVVDLSEDSAVVGARARAVAAACAAELALLHVVEYVPLEPMGESLLPAASLEQELVQQAGVRLQEFAAGLGLPPAACRVEIGNTKAEIVRVAAEAGADLVVIGSRERHGLSILVNLTEDTVLHAAPCDVLAVRLK